MKRIIFNLMQLILSYNDFSVVHVNELKHLKLIQYRNQFHYLNINIPKLDQFLQSIDIFNIKSQFGQDLFVLIMMDYKTDGFFVEFGALDGIGGSNSYILEKLGWKGIVSEPSRIYKRTKKNRKCLTYNLAVYSESGVDMKFLDNGGLSTLLPFVHVDHHERKGKSYNVKTITLIDLLHDSKAPTYIDFISIDTEGSEYDILENFDFEKYEFGIIIIEHNFVEEKREKINKLLSENGYIRVLENLTEVDDYYLNMKLYQSKIEVFKGLNTAK